MMVRRLSLAGVALLAGGLLVAVSPAASSASSCGSGPCPSAARASVAPHDVLAGSSQAGFTFTVTNLGNATLDSVRIVRPSTAIAIRSIGQQPPGWLGAIDAPDGASYAAISSPIGLAPGQTAVFQLLSHVSP